MGSGSFPSTTFISCSLTFLSGQVKTPLTRAQESRAASASAQTGKEPSAPFLPFWHLLWTGQAQNPRRLLRGARGTAFSTN